MKKILMFLVFGFVFHTTCAVAGEWRLKVYMGVTGWGPGGLSEAVFPSEESCYKALDRMVITGTKQQSGDDDEQTIAICIPEQ